MTTDTIEQSQRTFNHYALFSFKDAYWSLSADERADFHKNWLAALRASAQKVDLYQGTEHDVDLIVWSALTVKDNQDSAIFFEKFAKALTPYRHLIEQKDSLWGFTRPSQYSKARSKQEIDPFSEERKPYLIIYPFSKTTEWYLMSREARQGMMNEHIEIGHRFPTVRLNTTYSFGLDDQEFVVAFESDRPEHFLDLVMELRHAEASNYTLKDTPIFTCIHRELPEVLDTLGG